MTEEHGQPSLLEAVTRTIDLHRLIEAGAGVVVGVSGGMDSVVLLSLLHRLAGEPARRWRLGVAHLDHGLRDESATDARFVAELARGLGLPCAVRRCNVRAHARTSGQGIEQAGRQLRYEFLLEAARHSGADRVAVAHHADDNAETVLYRVLRGTALHGLAGMPIRRALKGDFLLFPASCPDCLHFTPEQECSRDSDARMGKVECPLFARREKGTDTDFRKSESVPFSPFSPELVRPLLECRRSEVERYARERGLAWREDASNADVHYRRNFIRHELLPAIREKLSSRADEALLRLAQHAAEIDAFLTAQAGQLLSAAAVGAQDEMPSTRGMGVSVAAATISPQRVFDLPVSESKQQRQEQQQRNNEDRTETALEHTGKMPVPHMGRMPMPPSQRFDAQRLAAADAAVQACAMRMILERAGLPMRTVGQQRIVALRAMLGPDGPRAIALGGGLEARRDGRVLIVGPAREVSQGDIDPGSRPGLSQCNVGSDAPPEVTLAPAGETILPGGGKISCAIQPLERAALAEHIRAARQFARGVNPAPEDFGLHVEWLDADELRGPLIARPRRDGDWFEPLGCAGGKSVSDFLTDLKLAHDLRRRVLCLCDELGVVCVWPIRIDRRVRVTDKTTRILKVIGL